MKRVANFAAHVVLFLAIIVVFGFLVRVLHFPNLLAKTATLVLFVGLVLWWSLRDIRGTAPDNTWLTMWKKRVAQGEVSAYLQELLAQHQQGDHSLDLLLSIAKSYIHLNQPHTALNYIKQAQAIIEASPDLLTINSLPILAEFNIVEYDARMLQGAFFEAGKYIEDGISDYSNEWAAKAAWAYYLAGHDVRARDMVKQIDLTETGEITRMRPHYKFVAAFLKHRLLGENTNADLQKLRGQMHAWSSELHRMKSGPYVDRALEVMGEIAPLIPYGWLTWGIQQLLTGHGQDLLANAQQKRAQGDQSYETTLSMAMAYSYLGHGREAEPLSRAAIQELESAGKFNPGATDAHWIKVMAYTNLQDALLYQGRYAEVIKTHRLTEGLSDKKNYQQLLLAWYLFLGGDHDQARAELKRVKPASFKLANQISGRYQLLGAHMQYILFPSEGNQSTQRIRLNALKPHLTEWDETIAHIVDSPYRRQLAKIVADIRSIINMND